MAIDNKIKLNSSNGSKTSKRSAGKTAEGKTVYDDSATGKFTDKSESKNSISEADELTIRAWKKTFENRKKAA